MKKSSAWHGLLCGLRDACWWCISPFRSLPDVSFALGKSALSQRIARQQFRTLVLETQNNIAASAGGSALVALCLWVLSPSWGLILWVGLSIVAHLWITSLVLRFRKHPPDDEGLRSWETSIGKATLLAGVQWAMPVFLLNSSSRFLAPSLAAGILLAVVGSVSLQVRYRPSIYWMVLPCSLMVSAALLAIGGLINVAVGVGFVVVTLLITRLALMQNDLMSQTLHHAEERLTLLHELELRRQEAQQANQAKTRFLAAASHDLRQPIHSIALLTNTLAQRSGADAKVHAQISASVQAMDDMLNGLLEVSKLDIDTAPLAVREVSLLPLLQRVQLQFQPQAQAKGISLQVHDTALYVQTDPEQLMRLLGNLVSNAIRFTSNGGVLLRARQRASGVWVQVWDSGTGIARADRPHIFEEFVQLPQHNTHADSAAKPAGGTRSVGLGLSIVRRIAQRLGHRVVLHSRPGVGSVFAVGLPWAQEATAQDSSARESLESLLEGKLVLLVEDDPAARRSMQWLLESCACHVLPAASTAQALALVDQTLRTPDLILSDYRLGLADTGLDCITQVRAAVGESIPALLMTAERSPPLEAAQQLGVSVLGKPVQLKDLLAALKRLFNG